MPDAWRAYLEMALGLTEAPRKRAQKVAGELVNRGGATAAQVHGLVDDLLSAGMANREALTNIVRYEVDRALGAVGLATAEEVTELTQRVRDLERQLRAAEGRPAGGTAVSGTSTGRQDMTGPTTGGTRIEQPAPVPRAAKKTAAKAVPNAMPSAGTTPSTPPANTAPAGDAPATAVAKKTVAKKVAKAVPPAPADPEPTDVDAKQAPAKQAPVKKSAARKPPRTEPAVPAGTAEAPTAPVREAAAATFLPPVAATEPPAGDAGTTGTPAKKAAKRAPAKKAAKKAAPPAPEA